MKQNDLRGGALAIAKDGRLVLAHGYTFAEKNYPLVHPTARFRIGSATKIMTGVGIHQLIEAGSLELDHKVQDILQLTPPPDLDLAPDFEDVTISHLLRHRGGWDRKVARELTHQTDGGVAAAFTKPVPISVIDLMRWGASQPMQFTPGGTPEKTGYSNFGFLLLGRVIAAKRGMSYEKAMRKHLFAPLGIHQADISRSLLEERLVDEAKYHQHPPVKKPSAVHADRRDVPLQYGGENGLNKEGYGGWVMSAVDVLRVLVALQGSNPPITTDLTQQLFWLGKSLQLPSGVSAFRHGATVGGAFGVAGLRSDGIAYAGFWNTKKSPDKYPFDFAHPATGITTTYNDHERCWNDIANKIESDGDWPSYDLFDQLFPPVYRWSATLNGSPALVEIKTIHTNGVFKGSITHDSQTSAVEGFWDGPTKQLRFLRVIDPAKPSTLQSYHGCFMENLDDKPILRAFAGAFQAFAGSGGTAARNRFGWTMAPEAFVDTSSIDD